MTIRVLYINENQIGQDSKLAKRLLDEAGIEYSLETIAKNSVDFLKYPFLVTSEGKFEGIDRIRHYVDFVYRFE